MSGLSFIVTRPEADAGTVARRLEGAGHAVIRAPLLAIHRRAGVVPLGKFRANNRRIHAGIIEGEGKFGEWSG